MVLIDSLFIGLIANSRYSNIQFQSGDQFAILCSARDEVGAPHAEL